MMVGDLQLAMVALKVQNLLLPGVKEKVFDQLSVLLGVPLKKVTGDSQRCWVHVGATIREQGGHTGGAV